MRLMLAAAGLLLATLPPVGAGPPEADTRTLDDEVRILLSSVDMTLGLIDAYGLCRSEELGHESCMAMIRSTLGHARGVIDHGPPALEH